MICVQFFDILLQENCPAGCPCDDYPCTETTTAPEITTVTVPATTTSPTTNAVLVLSTRNAANKPIFIDWEGKLLQIKSVYSIKNSYC